MGAKGSRYVELTTLPPLHADCLKIWEPQPPGAVIACSGLYSDYFTFCQMLLIYTFYDRVYAMECCM